MVKRIKPRAEFISSHENLADFMKKRTYKAFPQIAMVGRSNVGKSSLMNHFFQNKKLAFVAKTPGKTRLLNFYKSHTYVFVDLPGYGYAKISRKQRSLWGKTVHDFFENNEQLSLVLFLLDIRRDPNADDLLFYNWLQQNNLAHIFILTKTDKLNAYENKKRQEQIMNILNPKQESFFIHYSIFNKEGRDGLIKKLWD